MYVPNWLRGPAGKGKHSIDDGGLLHRWEAACPTKGENQCTSRHHHPPRGKERLFISALDHLERKQIPELVEGKIIFFSITHEKSTCA